MSDDELKRNAREYWDAAREKVKQGNSNFKGRQFPEDPSIKGFNGFVFTDEANFEGVIFEGSAYFNQTTFEKAALFNNATFKGAAHFRGVNFKNHAFFMKSAFTQHTDFVMAAFGANALFEGASISDGIFYDSRFYGGAEFGNVQFVTATFHRVVFEGEARFRGARFVKEALFPSVTFMRSATFEDCIFEGRVDFRGARAVEGVLFSMPARNKIISPFLHPEQGVSAYRLAKQAAISNGDLESAADYHFAERCAADIGKLISWSEPAFSHLPKLERAKLVVGGLFEYLVMRMLFGYGVKPFRIVLASLFLIVLFAFFYSNSHMVCIKETCDLSFVEALFISASTFTTLGYYGDYHLEGFTRFLIGGEAFLGTLLMSAFLVVLGRRYM